MSHRGRSMSRRALQGAVALGSLVPILAGGAGVLLGPSLVSPSLEAAAAPPAAADLDSHFRYLSGLLLAIGLGYASGVPGIERRHKRFLLLGGIVFIGGLGRLWSLLAVGAPSPVMLGALAMELLVTPLLTLWQRRVSRRFAV